MNLKESVSASCVGMPVFTNHVDDNPLHTTDESYNTKIKDEPLDITECSLNDFKSELEDFDVHIKDEPFLEENTNSDSEINVGHIIEKNTAGIIKNSLNNITNNNVPVTRKLIIDGQEKTCILLKNPALKDIIMKSIQRARQTVNNALSPNNEHFNNTVMDSMVTSPDKSHLIDHTYSLSKDTENFTLICSRCSSVVEMNNFRQHINSCFPRKTFLGKVSSHEANERKITSPNHTVQTVYNPNNKNKNSSLQLGNNSRLRNLNLEKKSSKNDNLKNVCLETDLRFPLYSEQLQKSDDEKNLFSVESSDQTKRVRRYNCDLCSYVTRKLNNFEIHKLLHVKKRPIIQCDQCTFRSTKRALTMHERKHRSEKALKMVESNTEDSLLSQDNTFSCSICSFTTCEQITLELHLQQHQFEPIERPTVFGGIKYDCRMCSYSQQTFSRITIHINSHRRNLPIRKCPKCDFKSTEYALVRHIQKCKKKNTPESIKNSEGVTTSQNTVELSESDKVSSEKSFKCMDCSFSSDNELKLQLHVKEKHLYEVVKREDPFGRLSYHCKLCSYSNPGFPFIINHMNLHKSDDPNVKCPYCDFKSIPKVLIGHVKKCELKAKVPEEKYLFKPVKGTDSLGHEIFYCKMCSYDSNRFGDILAHIGSHKKNEPIISCSYCYFKSTLKAVEHHRTKCKFANMEINKYIFEKAAEQDSVNCFTQNEVSFKSEEINSDLQNSTKTNLNTMGVEHMKVVSNETITDQKSVQSFEPDKDISGDMNEDLFKPKFLLTNSVTSYFQCKLCSYGDRVHKNVIIHINTHKKKMPILNCFNNCGFKSTAYAVNFHMKKCKLNETGNVFRCPVCTFATNLRIKLKLHVKKRHFNKLFSCTHCSFFTQYKSSYALHMKRHKKCPFCSFEAVAGIVKTHVPECIHKPKSFIKIQKYNCKLCSYNTPHYRNYFYHMNAHARSEPIEKCPDCDFISTCKALARHRVMKKHFGKKTTETVKCTKTKSLKIMTK